MAAECFVSNSLVKVQNLKEGGSGQIHSWIIITDVAGVMS